MERDLSIIEFGFEYGFDLQNFKDIKASTTKYPFSPSFFHLVNQNWVNYLLAPLLRP